MEPQRPRRKYSPRLAQDERRVQVLDAALEVLRTCALHDLSMEAVAAAADIAKPILYRAYHTRAELVAALLERELERGIAEVSAAMPADLSEQAPTDAYRATISAFLQAVFDNPTRWRLILTVPDHAPRDHRDSLRSARQVIVTQSQDLAQAAADMLPALADLDPELLGHSMLSLAEMLGRLAARDPATYPRKRLESFTNALLSFLPPAAD